MPRTNVVAIRDERGRYLKGIAGGPGRPLGSRNKLRDDFFADMARKLSSILRAFGPARCSRSNLLPVTPL